MSILAMKIHDGERGLYAAMENNHPLCVTRFLSKINGIAFKYKLSKANIMDLLKGATAQGTPALYIAMSKGNEDVVLSYISTLGAFAKNILLVNISYLHYWPLKIMTTCQLFI